MVISWLRLSKDLCKINPETGCTLVKSEPCYSSMKNIFSSFYLLNLTLLFWKRHTQSTIPVPDLKVLLFGSILFENFGSKKSLQRKKSLLQDHLFRSSSLRLQKLRTQGYNSITQAQVLSREIRTNDLIIDMILIKFHTSF